MLRLVTLVPFFICKHGVEFIVEKPYKVHPPSVESTQCRELIVQVIPLKAFFKLIIVCLSFLGMGCLFIELFQVAQVHMIGEDYIKDGVWEAFLH